MVYPLRMSISLRLKRLLHYKQVSCFVESLFLFPYCIYSYIEEIEQHMNNCYLFIRRMLAFAICLIAVFALNMSVKYEF